MENNYRKPEAAAPLGWVEVVLITIIVVTMLGVAGVFTMQHFPSFSASMLPDRPENILFLDAQKIIDAKMVQLRELIKTPGTDISGQGVAFGKDLASLVQSYADQGCIVLNSRYVAACPKDLDITEHVAKSLGVSLSGDQQ